MKQLPVDFSQLLRLRLSSSGILPAKRKHLGEMGVFARIMAALPTEGPTARRLPADRGYDADRFHNALQSHRPQVRNRIEIMCGSGKEWTRTATRSSEIILFAGTLTVGEKRS